MSAQNNPGRQADIQHATTIVAQADVVARRFIAYDGTYATSAGGAKDMQGASRSDTLTGQALALVTGYSALIEASAAIAFGAYIKPAADGTGRAAVGAIGDHCGRALGATSSAGQMVEVKLCQHVHA